VIKNLFPPLGFYILISICIYILSTIVFIPFNWNWNKRLIIPEIFIFLIMIYIFFHAGRQWLQPQRTKVQNALSMSLIPLTGLVVAIGDFLYRYHGNEDVYPFVLFNEAYAAPIFLIIQNSPGVIYPLWKEFIVIWGFSFFPTVIMYLGLLFSSKRTKLKG
jgi:hypothetical protein